MKISVVIPNFNGSRILKENLPKILDAVGDAEVIVIDDASTDDSVLLLRKYFPEVKIKAREKNEGFASAVNDGTKIAAGELILLLNSDVIPEKDFLKYLTVHFADPQVFAVGCLQYSNAQKGQTTHGRGIGKFEKGFLVHGPGTPDKKDTLWVFGGAGIFRKSIWEKLGGLDTLYNPFYWEDIDLSYRALKAGYKLVFEAKSVVTHDQTQGAIRSSYSQVYVNTIAHRNQILFVWLNITDLSLITKHLLHLPIHIGRALFTLNGAYLTGFILAILKIPYVLVHRNRNKNKALLSDKKILATWAS